MNPKVAHYISTFGNPLLTISVFSVIALFQTESTRNAVFGTLIILGGIVVPIVIKSYRGVQKGEYTNYDISNRKQRQSWYLLPTLLLAGVTLILHFTHQSRSMQLAVLFALVLFVMSQVVNIYLKTSLHVGFTVYLAFLIYPLNAVIAVAVLLFTVILGWSRIVLLRHTLKEVLCGAALGMLAGSFFLLTLYW
ncbi:MAG TPA: hypothetical protein PLO67_02045 [Saprospiraceae bacterium]|nr:hypothetical protein [Saprospiraceae bacterium]HPI05688.1 hypothetical protein [Saprospiraceae bacterium]